MTRTMLAAAAALLLLGSHAYAGEGYQDPSDLRTPGVTSSTKGMVLSVRDADPFGMRLPGSTSSTKGIVLSVRDADPFGLKMPGQQLALGVPAGGEASANVAGMIGQSPAMQGAAQR